MLHLEKPPKSPKNSEKRRLPPRRWRIEPLVLEGRRNFSPALWSLRPECAILKNHETTKEMSHEQFLSERTDRQRRLLQ